MWDLDKSKNILVVGLGKRTGLYTCNFLVARGYSVYVSDVLNAEALKDVIAKLDTRVHVAAGRQDAGILDTQFGLVVLSPGVPQTIPLIAAARAKKIPVIAEVELAYTFMRGKLIGITGTDGKSTTTTLVGHILNEIGYKAFTGGNLGTPFISFVDQTNDKTFSVVELSSFQLETIDSFKPDVAAVLNVTPDHLDRYKSMNEYLAAKMRITENQTGEDYFVYNASDNMICGAMKNVKSAKLSFSLGKSSDAYLDNGSIYISHNGSSMKIIDTAKLQIMGEHNIENTMSSILMVISALKHAGKSIDTSLLVAIEKACYSFNGLEHRMEKAGQFQGREFINDSKATTVGAVEKALKSLSKPGIVILGGRTKGDDYSRLSVPLKQKAKCLILIGESTPQFKNIFKDMPLYIAESMDDAVVKAMKKSAEGDIILLSPACASFDMFSNFEERGKRFKESVNKLRRGELWI